MLNLIEAYEIDDNILCSTIGSYDGNAYEKMLEVARRSKLNEKDKLDGFDEYFAPMLAHKL
jgi:hypothetical protein